MLTKKKETQLFESNETYIIAVFLTALETDVAMAMMANAHYFGFNWFSTGAATYGGEQILVSFLCISYYHTYEFAFALRLLFPPLLLLRREQTEFCPNSVVGTQASHVERSMTIDATCCQSSHV